MDPQAVFIQEGEVRDNEIDVQGIVNNTHYLVYMMHTRHCHIRSLGIDFVSMHNEGFDLVLVHVDLSLKGSLVSNDRYLVSSHIKPSGRIRIAFEQEIRRVSDEQLIAKAVNTATCIDRRRGRPCLPDKIREAFGL